MKLNSVDMAINPTLSSFQNSAAYDASKDNTANANKEIDTKEMTDTEKKNLPVSEKFIIEAIEKANKAIEGARTEFRFSIHKETHEIMVKVMDKDKGEVIREIPPKDILDMVAKMWELAGIIVDEKR